MITENGVLSEIPLMKVHVVTPTFYKNNFFANIEVHIGCISICRAYENPSKNNLA
jgi:hypothetical protein